MTNWKRVTKEFPCPICKKPDWCCVGDRYICCMRVQSGKIAHNGGWLHEIEGAKPLPLPPRLPYTPSINAERILAEWSRATEARKVWELAQKLGLPVASLLLLSPAWASDHQAWAFPMVDSYGHVIGIRLRDEHGNKWAVKGSKQGLFVPDCAPQELVIVCEGPTDTAAALSMGFYAVGRPSCLGCESYVQSLIRRNDIRRAVIFADNDEPGQTGARKLIQYLGVPAIIMYPPAKDLRDFVLHGGNAKVLHSLWGGMVWAQPK